MGSSTGTAFITLKADSTAVTSPPEPSSGPNRNAVVEGLTIFYPLQGIVSGTGTAGPVVEEYPYCICMGDPDELTDTTEPMCDNRVSNMTLVNPYQGIYCRMYNTAYNMGVGRVIISNVRGGPLNIGIFIDGMFDLAYIEKILFSPYYIYGIFSSVNTEHRDWNTYIAANLIAIHIRACIWTTVQDVFALCADRGLVLDRNQYQPLSPPHVFGHADFEGNNIMFDQCDACIEMISGEAYITNVRLTSALNFDEGANFVNDPSVYDTRRVITTGSEAGTLRIINGTIQGFSEALQSPPLPDLHCIDWLNPGTLDISNVTFIDNTLIAIARGIYATDGRISLCGCRFQHNSDGFTQAFEITSGVECAIIAGNDYRDNQPGTNDAQNINGEILLRLPAGNNGIILESAADGYAPFLTWKGHSSGQTDKYSIRYNNTTHKLDIGWGDTVDHHPQMTIDQATGDVGIGTTTPSAKLTLAGGDFLVDNGGNSRYLVFTQKSGVNYGLHFDNSDDCLRIWTNSNPRLTVDSAGNVGIGVTGPGEKLDVDGNINVTSGNGYRVDGTQVVGTQQAAVSISSIQTTGTADSTYSNTEMYMLNNLKTDVTNLRASLNDLVTKLSSASGHGLLT